MADESMWIDRAQTAEAKVATAQAGNERLKEKIRFIKETFGAKERTDGSFEINYQKFVDMLGREKALEVRAIIDETYNAPVMELPDEGAPASLVALEIPGTVVPLPIPPAPPVTKVEPVFTPEPLRVAVDNSPPESKLDEFMRRMDERMAYMEERLGV